jgi:ribosomal-protein-alanine N-acetyltransferase
MSTPIGLFQVRSLEPRFSTAEWGFALGSSFWGTGLFVEAARLVGDFAFGTMGVRRLEARACVQNDRGNGALRKLGATQEGVLRRSFLWQGEYYDQMLWSILDSDWNDARGLPELS